MRCDFSLNSTTVHSKVVMPGAHEPNHYYAPTPSHVDTTRDFSPYEQRGGGEVLPDFFFLFPFPCSVDREQLFLRVGNQY